MSTPPCHILLWLISMKIEWAWTLPPWKNNCPQEPGRAGGSLDLVGCWSPRNMGYWSIRNISLALFSFSLSYLSPSFSKWPLKDCNQSILYLVFCEQTISHGIKSNTTGPEGNNCEKIFEMLRIMMCEWNLYNCDEDCGHKVIAQNIDNARTQNSTTWSDWELLETSKLLLHGKSNWTKLS